MGEQKHHITLEDLTSTTDRMMIDVRKPPAFEASGRLIPGAVWRHPFDVDRWVSDISGPVVIYCVHGHEVSQGVAAYLRARSLDAVYLEGGFERYVAAGGETEAA